MKNIERIKSFLLAFLVLTTIYLAQQLWIEFPSELLSSFAFGQESTSGKEYTLPDFILPEKYIVNFGGKNRAVLYFDEDYELWDKSKEILKVVFQSKNLIIEEIGNEELESISKRRSIYFYFPDELYTFIFSKMFGGDITSSMNDSVKKINSIYINLDSARDSFIVLGDDSKYYKISGPKLDVESLRDVIDKISKSNYTRAYTITELLAADNSTYIPLEMNFNLSQVYVRQEIDVNSEVEEDSIARLFFDRDLAYIRRIEENNGSVIYIDSQRTLKIHENGTLEYFKAIEADVEEGNLHSSLSNSIDFINTHLGWPKDTYLFKIDEIQFDNTKGYKFIFKYKMDGLTVISDYSGEINSIEIEVLNNQVRSYKRRIWEQIGKVKPKSGYKSMLSAYDIIDKNYSFIKTRYIEDNEIAIEEAIDIDLDEAVKSSIKDAYLVYYDNLAEENQVLKPTWIIDVAGYSYIFDAYDGYVENGGNPRQ